MRLLYVIDSLAPGGAETSLAEMAPGLISNGIELFVLPLGPADGLSGRLRESGAAVIPRHRPSGRFHNVRVVMDAIKQFRPALVHTTLFESDVAGRTAARFRGIPTSSSWVSESYGAAHFREMPTARFAKLQVARMLDGTTAQLAARIHAVSEVVAQSVGARLRVPRDRIDVISRGRSAARFPLSNAEVRHRVRTKLDIPVSTPLILGVGRQEPPKGFADLFAALPEVAERHPEARVLIAGRTGTATSELEHRAKRSPIPVRFLGHRTDVPDLMSAADVLAFPSHREGSPGTLIEAMAVGLPIVASDIAPNLEVLGPVEATALTVPVGNPGELGRGIAHVLDHSELTEQRRAAARRRFEREYTIEAVAERMADFFVLAAGDR